MDDGSGRPIEDITVQDMIRTITEHDHERQSSPATTRATVLAVHRHEGAFAVSDVLGAKVTSTHRWAVAGESSNRFAATKDLASSATRLRTYAGGGVSFTPAPPPTAAGTASRVFNLTSTARTFLVAGQPAGPWYLVHNTKKDEDP